MKKTENRNSNKKALTIGGLSALCIAVLAGAYFLTREPANEFVPAPAETETKTDTWSENANTDILPATASDENISQIIGTASDDTQKIISEDENGTVTSLSNTTSTKDTVSDKPSEKPETSDDTTNPDKQPEYDDDVPQTPDTGNAEDTTPPTDNPPSDTPSQEHPGQVYDPVFGWIDTGDTHQDNVDSDGDINTQIGTMN